VSRRGTARPGGTKRVRRTRLLRAKPKRYYIRNGYIPNGHRHWTPCAPGKHARPSFFR